MDGWLEDDHHFLSRAVCNFCRGDKKRETSGGVFFFLMVLFCLFMEKVGLHLKPLQCNIDIYILCIYNYNHIYFDTS